MPTPSTDPTLAGEAAALIADSFAQYMRRFLALSRVAGAHFSNRDWHAMQRDSGRRLDLYGDAVGGTQTGLRLLLGARLADRGTWTAIRANFESLVTPGAYAELAETFFNSNVRRIFHTVGVDPEVEFVSAAIPRREYRAPWSHTRTVPCDGDLALAFRRVLEGAGLRAAWDDLRGDAERLVRAVPPEVPAARVRAIEVARTAFFRGKGAYLVGHLHLDTGSIPLVIALLNPRGRVVVDAALFTENEISVVFSFARSYLFAETGRPREMVDWLRTIMPRKPVSDLWNSIGFHRHGKTELYRSLLEHLANTDEKFAIAPGKRGMVMSVFALPGFDVVFKLIRDRFEYPKTVTHAQVREKYELVYRHDRAGRLVDAQTFEHLDFPAERFDPALLDDLLTHTSESVKLRGGRVVIAHLYTERRLLPLDLFLAGAAPEAAREAVVDYGQALKDLAATNIFPGDMLLKNFGVTRHGRLVFYDYDELCPLLQVRFRDLPAPRGDDEEVASEPWYFVGEHDVFPEEFRAFLGLRGDLLEAFLAAHGDLLEAGWWRRMQDRLHQGEIIDVFPYRTARRLRPGPG
ncbi:MAG: bifunctional isocitrate dehydrogenase kinase/phosphatase [Candidatus Eisenbacteria bacterium]|nr:bifunctional isocitrate dehydrogenase kinase/phosphatase [Candidatus Eisenbacteria bacterium]